jgi:hypothetical protein
MSGGYFNYIQYQFDEPIEQMEEVVQELLTTNERGYSEDTIQNFKDTLTVLKLSKIYLHRADWLLSDDDGEESYYERLYEDLGELNNALL